MIEYIILKIVMFSIENIYGINSKFEIFREKSLAWYLFAMAIWYVISMLTQNLNKKYVFISSFFIALVIGLDRNIGDLFCLSRVITFYPFFFLGNVINEEQISKIYNNKLLKGVSIIFLFTVLYNVFIFIDKVYLIRPILTGRNPYYSLNNSIEDYGMLLRIAWYFISSLTSVAIMSLTPKGKTFFSKFGARTLAVYFLHAIVTKIFVRDEFSLRVYQYLIISFIVTFGFSFKWFSIPFNKIMKLNFNNKGKDIYKNN